MIELIHSPDKPIILTETVGSDSKHKTFSSFKALEKALQTAGISNSIRYPLLKHGKVKNLTSNGTIITLEIKAAMAPQQETARDTQHGETEEGFKES